MLSNRIVLLWVGDGFFINNPVTSVLQKPPRTHGYKIIIMAKIDFIGEYLWF